MSLPCTVSISLINLLCQQKERSYLLTQKQVVPLFAPMLAWDKRLCYRSFLLTLYRIRYLSIRDTCQWVNDQVMLACVPQRHCRRFCRSEEVQQRPSCLKERFMGHSTPYWQINKISRYIFNIPLVSTVGTVYSYLFKNRKIDTFKNGNMTNKILAWLWLYVELYELLLRYRLSNLSRSSQCFKR